MAADSKYESMRETAKAIFLRAAPAGFCRGPALNIRTDQPLPSIQARSSAKCMLWMQTLPFTR